MLLAAAKALGQQKFSFKTAIDISENNVVELSRCTPRAMVFEHCKLMGEKQSKLMEDVRVNRTSDSDHIDKTSDSDHSAYSNVARRASCLGL